MGISVTFHGAIPNELALAQRIVELKNKIDYEKAHFKKNMHKLSVANVQISKKLLHDLKTEFHKKREEAKGSRERMKSYAQKCVQAHNEAEKRKALGRPAIAPRMAAKKSKKHAEANPDTARHGPPSSVAWIRAVREDQMARSTHQVVPAHATEQGTTQTRSSPVESPWRQILQHPLDEYNN